MQGVPDGAPGSPTEQPPLCFLHALQYTTATRGAFLIQTTAIFTPLLAAAAGVPPSRPGVWVGSLLGLVGAVLVGLEGSATAGGEAAASDGALTSLGEC